MGETAPIIMVGATFYMSGLPTSIYDKFMALPYHTFILATQHSSPYASTYAAGNCVYFNSVYNAVKFWFNTYKVLLQEKERMVI